MQWIFRCFLHALSGKKLCLMSTDETHFFPATLPRSVVGFVIGKAMSFIFAFARQPSLLWQPFCALVVGGSSLCWLPRMKFMWRPVMELWHILPQYIICLYDLDLWPTFTKIGPCDLDHILKICAYFEVYRSLRFWYIRSWNADFVAPLLGNQCCHGNRFLPQLLGGRPNVSPLVWS